jgi:hypothetical protein
MTLLLFVSSACFRPSPWMVASARLCYPIGMALVQAHILCSSSQRARLNQNINNIPPRSVPSTHASSTTQSINCPPTQLSATLRTTAEMAGGKGKSSGGKSSGGKVGADGSKKQQSHSSKAGLQVSSSPPTTFAPQVPVRSSAAWFESLRGIANENPIPSTPPKSRQHGASRSASASGALRPICASNLLIISHPQRSPSSSIIEI